MGLNWFEDSSQHEEAFSQHDETSSYENCVGVKLTRLALLVRFSNGKTRWVPQSVIDEDSEVYQEDEDAGTLILKRWWADQENIDDLVDQDTGLSSEVLEMLEMLE